MAVSSPQEPDDRVAFRITPSVNGAIVVCLCVCVCPRRSFTKHLDCQGDLPPYHFASSAGETRNKHPEDPTVPTKLGLHCFTTPIIHSQVLKHLALSAKQLIRSSGTVSTGIAWTHLRTKPAKPTLCRKCGHIQQALTVCQKSVTKT